MAAVARSIPHPLTFWRYLLRRVFGGLDALGRQIAFYAKVVVDCFIVIPRYPGEVMRIIGDITWGSGALIVGAGTAGVIFFMAFITGGLVGLEGYKALQLIGAESFSGFVSAFGNTREITPIIAGVTLAAQVGAGFTAELGAMRISDEIDALEVMAVNTRRYLVASRVVAAMIAITPLYLVSLFASYLATQVAVVHFQGLSAGTFAHYFALFLPPIDVFYSLVKAWIFAAIVAMIHCYYGYNAHGGPVGVGTAVGKAIRTSIVAINLVNFALSALMWGIVETVRIAG
ncbi:MAG: ABC transporter permease [Actinobacteria bacterium]|nr:MAG: ABC transporter permease [Actinomycetota bacterium]